MGLKILYIDMDNVLVDFPSGIARIPPEVVDEYDDRLDMDPDGKITILFLSASPSDETHLRVDQEFREIQEQLQRAKRRDKFRLEIRPAARPRDISQAILDVEPNIVHFSGHGSKTGDLCFENLTGKSQPVPPQALSSLFELCADQVSCVLLNACYSKIQAEAISQHIPFVIGMNDSIRDDTAITFSTGFYKALGAGKPVDSAFKWALTEIELENISGKDILVLHLQRSLNETGKWVLSLSMEGTVDNINKPLVDKLLAELEPKMPGFSYKFTKAVPGSINLFFEGDWKAYEHLRFLVKTNQLRTLAGFPVLEIRKTFSTSDNLPVVKAIDVEKQLDFAASPEVVWAIAEGERLAYGHLANPAFAIETSLIDPLPHQRIAVYRYLLREPRLRFLLADDAGAGKTIMAGLYIREMLSRRLIRRVLIVPPAGLVGNWRSEMRSLFNLSFRIIGGSEARSKNSFVGPDSDLVIVSVDTLAGDRMFARLQEETVEPYDLVIFDEAHKLSADREPDLTIRKTNRYQLAEALAGANRDTDDDRWYLPWSCRHLLLLTATPHMGKDYPYYFLWRLLQPEVLSTYEAFAAYPAEARSHHFIRRTKEEMVKFDGTKLYPMRETATLSYDLSQGEVSEQKLYDETTHYIDYFYNRARILNRSAARLAMSIFQRRLASSTYALLRSFERRLNKLEDLIRQIESSEISEDLAAQQAKLDKKARDVLDETTADEENIVDDEEEHDQAEDEALGGFAASSLEELKVERFRVEELLQLARAVYDQGEESKFEKLREVLYDPEYKDEKIIIFTEHRDTLNFLVSRLEGLGFTGSIAQIYGGMPYTDREAQVEFFRKPPEQGGATYLVATDAAGEGINLQFCWLMINYDIPWNPARLEQRMGRIHRYGQKRDPVIILNIVADKTREGKVLKTLLDKLELIRKQLQADKVFDVIGRVFEGVSIKQYIERASQSDEASEVVSREIEGRLTVQQVEAKQAQERKLYETGGDVKALLPELLAEMENEDLRRLLPGFVRRFLQRAAPLLGLEIKGNLDEYFSLEPASPNAVNPLWPIFERYPEPARNRLTVYKPTNKHDAIFLHPGELVFDYLWNLIDTQFEAEAGRGALFIDPTTTVPYLFHLALVTIVRKADPQNPHLRQDDLIEQRLVGLKQWESDAVEECPVGYLSLLKGGEGIPPQAIPLVAKAQALLQVAYAYGVQTIGEGIVYTHRQALETSLPEREKFLKQGFGYQEAELAQARRKQKEKARSGNTGAKSELTKIKHRQEHLKDERDLALAALRNEPALIAIEKVEFITHALVVPTRDPEERKRFDKQVEQVAMGVAIAHEEAQGAQVRDVSKANLARAAGLVDYPGFDLLAEYPNGERRAIEVKGRAVVGEVELTENEWVAACNQRDRYWLYVVYDCGSSYPRLMRVKDPFMKLVVRSKTSVVVDQREIFQTAETDD